MLVVTNLNYASEATVLFQRVSVILTDWVLYAALCYYFSSEEEEEQQQQQQTKTKVPTGSGWQDRRTAMIALTFCNAGLLIVDHIHFQYNGFLMGIFILSLAWIKKGHDLWAGLTFAALLHFKHIFLYAAPAYFFFLLRHYCAQGSRFHWLRFIALGSGVIAVSAVSFGPFIAQQQLPQLLARLFPFKRGLCHAYWAPNVWALYQGADKLATYAVRYLPFPWARQLAASLAQHSGPSSTAGLVASIDPLVLPSISPGLTALLTFVSMTPALISLWRRPRSARLFVDAVAYCCLCAFMLGYHVHEKAILMVVLPMSLMCLDSPRRAGDWLSFGTLAHYSLLPLLFRPEETLIKFSLVGFFFWASYWAIQRYALSSSSDSSVSSSDASTQQPWLSSLNKALLVGLLPLQICVGLIQPLLLPRLPFLPLMCISLYCALANVWFWIRLGTRLGDA